MGDTLQHCVCLSTHTHCLIHIQTITEVSVIGCDRLGVLWLVDSLRDCRMSSVFRALSLHSASFLHIIVASLTQEVCWLEVFDSCWTSKSSPLSTDIIQNRINTIYIYLETVTQFMFQPFSRQTSLNGVTNSMRAQKCNRTKNEQQSHALGPLTHDSCWTQSCN